MTTVEAMFAPHGRVEGVVPRHDGTTVYVKPNGIHFTPYTHTDPAVLEAALAYLRDHGYTRLAVMESCTGGWPRCTRSPGLTSAPSRG